MKIAHLERNHLRLWKHNVPVLVYSETGEAVMDSNGNPRTAVKGEIAELLRTGKKKKLFTLTVDGKECHFVRGRSYIEREMARAHGGPVQLRNACNQILKNYRPRHVGHDILQSECQPVERERPYRSVDVPLVQVAAVAVVAGAVPEPEHCDKCKEFTKPIGCRQDEHHFVCEYHDAYEAIRRRRLEEVARGSAEVTRGVETKVEDLDFNPFRVTAPSGLQPTTDNLEPSQPFILDLETGEALRTASPSEVAEAAQAAESSGMPIIEIGGTRYAVASEDFTLPESAVSNHQPSTMDQQPSP